MIIEHRTFRLAPGTGEQSFLAAERRVQTEVAPFQRGFIRRTTAPGDDGRRLVETLWYSDVDALTAAEAEGTAIDSFRVEVDPASVRVERWSTMD